MLVGMVELFAALAEPNRLRIVELLRDGARPVGGIGRALNMGQPQVSKHLRVLKEARLVEVDAQAQQRVYGLRTDALQQLDTWLARYRQLWDARMQQLDGLLEELQLQAGQEQARQVKRRKPR